MGFAREPVSLRADEVYEAPKRKKKRKKISRGIFARMPSGRTERAAPHAEKISQRNESHDGAETCS